MKRVAKSPILATERPGRSRRPLHGLFAALLLAFASGAQPAAAQATPQAPASPTAPYTDPAAWSAALVRWAQPLHELLGRHAQALQSLVEGAERAGTFFGEGDERGGATWARAWKAERVAEWDALRAAAAANRGEVPAASPQTATEREMVERMRAEAGKMPQLVKSLIQESDAQARPLLDLIERTAGGDEQAVDELPIRLIGTSIALLKAENAMVAAALPMIPIPDHPHRDFATASMSTNLAVVAMFEHQRAVFTGRPADAAATAATVRRHADSMVSAADAMEKHAAALQAPLIQAIGSGDPKSQDKARLMLASYREQAEQERRIAAELREAAGLFDSGEELDWEAIGKKMEGLQPLVDRRNEIDQRRRRFLGE